MFLERMEHKNNPQLAIIESEKKQEEEKKEVESQKQAELIQGEANGMKVVEEEEKKKE